MVKLAGAALAGVALGGALIAGCELIADIPTPISEAPGDGATQSCTSSAQCAEPTPICLLDRQICVACTVDAECTASPAEPICAPATHACRGCVADEECPAGVCLADGACADPARFVYAAAAGTGTACTSAAPCSVDTAVTQLTAAKDIVKLAPGVYQRSTGLVMTIAGTLAGGGSTFQQVGGDTSVLITAMGVPVSVVGLALTTSTAMAGFRCQSAGGELHLSRVRLAGGATGLYAMGCPTTVDRSRFSGLTYYAVYVDSAPLVLRNTYVVNNGNATYDISAVHLANVPSGAIEQVTIANNTGVAEAGLQCVGSPNVTLKNLIVWGNTAPGIAADCTVANSVVDPAYTGGANNLTMDPRFIDASTLDYRLMAGSPAAGIGDPAVGVDVDADGEPRPQPAGSSPDPGADEIP